MATISYYLKTPELKESPIYLRVSAKGSRLRIPTSEKIPVKYWIDKPTCRAKKTVSFPEGPELNEFLNSLEKKTSDLIKSYKRNGTHFSLDTLKEKVKEFLNRGEIKPNSFFAVYDQFLATASTERSVGTIKKFNTLREQLINFQRTKRVNVNFDSLNVAFYDKLADYYLNDLGVVNNTFGKYVSALKTFLNWATDRGYNNKIDYRKFRAFKEDADIVYLNQRELSAITDLSLVKNPKLEKVRDVFCLGCFTGLRFSDLAKLRAQNVKGDHIIIKSQKTRDTLFIPLRDEAQTIILRYKDKPGFFPIISNQKMNDYLKELARLAGLDEEVTITRYQGAKEIKITKPKCEMISTHTARRTFVTLSLEQGARPEIVMQITGHKSYSTFKKYIKITNKVIYKEMERVWNSDSPSPKQLILSKA